MLNDEAYLVFTCSALVCLRPGGLATHSLVPSTSPGLGTKHWTQSNYFPLKNSRLAPGNSLYTGRLWYRTYEDKFPFPPRQQAKNKKNKNIKNKFYFLASPPF